MLNAGRVVLWAIGMAFVLLMILNIISRYEVDE
jgi:hypothetical protein